MTNAIKLYKFTENGVEKKGLGINWDSTSWGNTVPSVNLHVNGTANISGDLLTGGSISIHRASGTAPYLEINNQTYSMGPYINDTNRGLYDWGSDWSTSGTNSWIVNIDSSGVVNIPHSLRVDGAIDVYRSSGTGLHFQYTGSASAYLAITNYGASTPTRVRLNVSGAGARGLYDPGSDTLTNPATGNEVEVTGTGSWIINIDADGIVNIPHIVKANNVNSYYQASGTSTTVQITSLNTITQVTLVSGGTNDIKSDITNNNYSISSGGIKVAQAGTYRITASVHMTTASMTDAFRKQIFVRQGTDFSSATEILQATDLIPTDSNGIQGAITIGPKIVTASANDIFFLACRFSQPATSTATVHGSFYSGNTATYLLVERVG